jgi:hypothetical protein
MCIHTIYILIQINTSPDQRTFQNRILNFYQTDDPQRIKSEIRSIDKESYIEYTKKGMQVVSENSDRQWVEFVKLTKNEKEFTWRRGRKTISWLDTLYTRKELHEFYNQPIKTNIFEEHHCPIFVSNSKRDILYKIDREITINARLEDWEFYKVFDAYSAYQELSIYLGGLAEPRKPIPKIDDVTMAEIKGFNKFSFRKDKVK